MPAVDIAPLRFIAVEPPTLRAGDSSTNVWQDGERRDVAFSASHGEWHWLRIIGAGSYRFPISSSDESVSAEVVPERGADERVIIDSYYRTVVPLALQAYGLEVLHGSAVAVAGRVVALCAQRETGKSTLAFALQRRGGRAVADDAVVVAVADAAGSSGPRVYPVPFALRLREASAEHFGTASKAAVAVGPLEDQRHDLGAAAPTPPL
ncbi:MAG TPA: hypothetical protein VFD39_13525, partial [Trueperaceae bacterium]|nr:hypothetical protein [Trueperaceae bacterium]